MRTAAITMTFFVAVLIATTYPYAPIQAQENEEAKAKANDYFKRGIKLVGEQAYREAAIEFQKAYDISPHYSVLFNLGMAYVALDRPVEAVDALNRYLRDGDAAISQPRRDDVATEIKRQNAGIGYLTVRVEPDGASVRVDDRELGKGPLTEPIRLGIGSHTVAVSLHGYQSSEVSIALAGEENKTAQVILRPIKAGEENKSAQVALKPIESVGHSDNIADSRSNAHTQRIWAYATGGTGIALGIASVVIFAWNDWRHRQWERKRDELDGEYAQKSPTPDYDELDKSQSENNSLYRKIHVWDAVTIGAAIAGGVFLVTGTVLYLTGDNVSKYDDVKLKVNQTSAAIEWNTKW